jgi:hypothetical protein
MPAFKRPVLDREYDRWSKDGSKQINKEDVTVVQMRHGSEALCDRRV